MKKFSATLAAISLLAFPITASPSSAAEGLRLAGPGGRIHGADISRWQHPDSKPINFVKMHAAGVDFVMIKASDTRSDADQLTLKYLGGDRKAAQSAGIYTGFYHYAILPDVSTASAVAKDARAQAQKVIWRIASLGGYNQMDLPYSLDLENNCVRYNDSRTCTKRASRTTVTLWAKTFMAAIKAKTGRTPIFYSYPTFLENAMVRDAELRQYPLWLAQYALDPTKPTSAPGVKNIGCYVHSWTTSSCKSQWIVWQYTSCGIAPKYGVPGTRLDLNVFRGTHEAFMNLATGLWIPEQEDLMPHGETSTIVLDSLYATTTDKSVVATVQVFRPDSSPVVTGEAKFISGGNITPMKFTQSIARSTSGQWKINIKGVQAGTWNGQIKFTDVSETHAEVAIPVSFTVTQGEEVQPSPTARPKPSTKPVNACKNQIKN
jgi:GH25 family lysozyme M1 (1,4-beta-N-acetylmuramidase)